jgi:hypothetical protein
MSHANAQRRKDTKMISINWQPTNRDLRQFAGIWFPVFWIIVAVLVLLRGGSWAAVAPMMGLAVAVGVTGLIWPQLMQPIFIGWMCVAFPIGWVVSHLLLAAVFYLVITPLGLVMRLAGRDKLKLRFDQESKTYWTRRLPTPPASRYFRQF